MAVLQWAPLTEADLPQLAWLAQECLRVDGGFPMLSDDGVLRGYFFHGPSLGGRDETGDLVAAVALFPDRLGALAATGMVHPSLRRMGHGEALVEWARAQAGDNHPLVVAETMSLEAEALFARSGLRRVFAETVMRHDLAHIARVALPAGLRTEPFSEATADAFHEAYRLSFAERPGFPDTPKAEWLDWVTQDTGFRPEDSRVAFDEGDNPVGFVILDDDWLDQVGVVPGYRGRRLGAHLVVRSLSAFRKSGAEHVWLCVNVDNPSRFLYERLGFVAAGTRARYSDR